MKSYSVVGNRKKVTMETNASRLKVVGNNCVIRVANNQGEIEVIGSDCRIEVEDNIGRINLVGSNGSVVISRRVRGDNVQMIGANCTMDVAGKKSKNGYEAQLSPFSRDLDDVINSIFTFVMR